MEIAGVAGTGTTVAAFGIGGAGISVQKDVKGPLISLHNDRDQTLANDHGNHFANGYASIPAQEINSGKLKIDMRDYGTKDNFTPTGRRALILRPLAYFGEVSLTYFHL